MLFQLLFGFIVLGFATSWLVSGASLIAQHFRLPKLTIGITVVALGTSVPEIAISAIAALNQEPNISVGNIIGSNIANTIFILPLAGLVHRVVLPKLTIKLELPLILICTLFVYALMMNDTLNRIEALILIAIFMIIMTWLVWSIRLRDENLLGYEIAQTLRQELPSAHKSTLYLIVGLLLIAPSSYFAIEGAKGIAHYFDKSNLFVGLFITAIGTSLPELATSIVSLIKKEKGIMIGNIIGSNLINLLIALPIATLINPIHVSPVLLSRDLPFLIMMTLLLIIMGLVGKKPTVLSVLENLFYLLAYGGYLFLIAFSDKL